MKFLGWMHRKMMQNNTESMKSSIIGNLSSCFPVQTSLDEQNYYKEPIKTLSQANIKSKKSSKSYEANMEEMLSNEELFEPFEFLAIGTFGIEPLNAGSPTSTLPAPFENVTNEQTQTEVTENDLKLVNYKIEKILEAEDKGNMNDTTQRNGQKSIIIHSNEPIEGGMQVVACPLQKYLFATSIELAETETEIRKEKTSLGELFKRSDTVSDPIKKCEEAGLPTNKGKVARIMKKVVKKFHCSASSCPADFKNDDEVSLAIKQKISKVIKIFHKKVYPEEMNEKKLIKLKKGKKNSPHEDGDQIGMEKETRRFDLSATKNNKMSMKKLFSDSIHKGDPTEHGGHGHWIKTDSNYLILEL